MRRLMQAPDPTEMRAARDDEHRSLEALMKEYEPPKDDWKRGVADIGIGMANSNDQNLGTAFAKGVGYADQRLTQREQLQRQAKRELAQIQLSMSRENRKELTDAERTRLTTLAQMIRERSASEDRLADRAATRDATAATREATQASRDAALGETRRGNDIREAAESRQAISDWESGLARQEPVWQRAAEAASQAVHPEDRPAFVQDYVGQRRQEYERRNPRPSPGAIPRQAEVTPREPLAQTPGAEPLAAQTPPGGPRFRPKPPEAGDPEETEATARNLNVPPLANTPWRGLSPKKREELLVRERTEFIKGDEDRQTSIDQATRLEDLSNEWLQLQEQVQTGTWDLKTPIVRQVSKLGNQALERLESITAELAPLNRVAGTGAVSNYDAEQLTNQQPSIEKTPEANKMIIQYRLRAAQNLKEKAAFDRAYFEANRSMQGAQRAWDEYKNANPLAIKNPDKKSTVPFALNDKRMSWAEYFRLKDLEAREAR